MNKDEYKNRESNIKKTQKSEEPKKEQSASSFWVWSIIIGLGAILGWGIIKNILLFIVMVVISAFEALFTPLPWVCFFISLVVTVIIKKL